MITPAFTPPTDAQRRYLNDLAVRVNRTIAQLSEQYGTYSIVNGRQRFTKRNATALITILERRLAGRAREFDEFARDLPSRHANGRLRRRPVDIVGRERSRRQMAARGRQRDAQGRFR